MNKLTIDEAAFKNAFSAFFTRRRPASIYRHALIRYLYQAQDNSNKHSDHIGDTTEMVGRPSKPSD
jgi:hypothetical protein